MSVLRPAGRLPPQCHMDSAEVPQAPREDGMGLRGVGRCQQMSGLCNGGRHPDHAGFLWKMMPQRPHVWLGLVRLIYGLGDACGMLSPLPPPSPVPLPPYLGLWLTFPAFTVSFSLSVNRLYRVPPQTAHLLWWKS